MLTIAGSLTFVPGASYVDTIFDTGLALSAWLGQRRSDARRRLGRDLAVQRVQTGTPYTILTDTGGGLGVCGNTFSAAPISYEHLTGALSYSNPDDVVLTFACRQAARPG